MKFNHMWRQAGALVFGALFLGGSGALAAQGIVSGRVTDAATKQPLQQAQVNIVGTTQRVLTNQDGQFRLTNVPAGTALVRVVFIGYKAESQSVFVTAGATATADFALTAAAVGLDAIVVTPSGDQSVRQEGNHMPTVQMTNLTQTQAITNLSDAINARVPGVVVQQSGGTTGSGTRIRIRGSNSVSLSNDPVLVVDGVRVDNTSSSSTVGVGGQVPSRLNDYNADDIESIQVSEGPSAGVLYGTDAANGAIIMQTKKGHPGPTVWNVNFEGGLQNDVGNYPANYRGVTAANASCRLTQVEAGSCVQANVLTLNPIEQFSPFRTGNLTNMGISASGGNEQTTYYVSGHYDFTNGVYAVNTDKQVFLRGNIHHQAASNLIFDVSTGYVTSELRLPQNDNNVFGVLSSGFLGGTDSTVNQGYGFLTPTQSFSIHTFQLVDHFTGSFNAKYTPRSWLEINAALGNDFISRRDENTFVPGAIPNGFNSNAFIGSRNANPFQIYTYTANVYGTAEFLLTPTITSRTSAGLQYFRSDLHGVSGSVLGLTAGSGSLAGGVIPTVNEQTTETATFGKFVEERVGLKDRLFFTGSLRSDQNSSFGKSFGNILYPKIAGSWVISEEPFFPTVGWLNSLRLRAAYGKSGLHPNALDALQYFTATPVVVASTDVPGVTVGGLGNINLKPESDGEFEGGFDADLWNQRINLVVTGYSKTSTDALIAVTEPPSCGACSTTQFRNLGQITNKGIEIQVTGDVFRNDNVDVSLSVGMWGNRNRVVTLGQNIAPIIFGLGGFSQRIQPGYSAGAYFMVPYTFNDANKDGIIGTNEVTLGSSAVFMGNAFPDHGITIRPDITVMQRWHLAALFDGRYGNKLFNSTEQFRCGLSNCQGRNDPKAPLADQAAAVANILGTQAGYIQDGAFMKLREVSLTFDAPDRWAHAMGASALSVSISGRNLKTWTNYKGLDPELNEAGQSNFTTADFLTQPPVRTWVTRINLTF